MCGPKRNGADANLKAITTLAATIPDEKFLTAFQAPKAEIDSLVAAKAVTIGKLMEQASHCVITASSAILTNQQTIQVLISQRTYQRTPMFPGRRVLRHDGLNDLSQCGGKHCLGCPSRAIVTLSWSFAPFWWDKRVRHVCVGEKTLGGNHTLACF